MNLRTPYGTANEILQKVCDYYGVEVEHVKSKSRKWQFVAPRYVTAELLSISGLTHECIAELLNRDQSVISIAKKSVRHQCETDQGYNKMYNEAAKLIFK